MCKSLYGWPGNCNVTKTFVFVFYYKSKTKHRLFAHIFVPVDPRNDVEEIIYTHKVERYQVKAPDRKIASQEVLHRHGKIIIPKATATQKLSHCASHLANNLRLNEHHPQPQKEPTFRRVWTPVIFLLNGFVSAPNNRTCFAIGKLLGRKR